ncbi:uncharacterized protein [Asterias amurensis]|uniref:uncharacterized protein isoform X2 n=1 Tax=Asterias amurensis TaxID=7602 RepID=UPI003AB1CED2
MMSALMETDRVSSLILVHALWLSFVPWILTKSVDNDVRLVGGSDTIPNAGRVEVWNTDSSEWLPVCASYWDFRDGQVVCRELGYPGTLSVDYHYKNDMTRTAGGFQCYGTETSLSRCRRSPGTSCLGLQAGVKCSAPGYIGCFYVFNPSGHSPIFWTYKAYSDWSVGTCVQKSRRLYGQDSDFPKYLGVRQSVCWFNLRLSRFEGRRRSDAMCDFNCVKTAGEECGGYTTIAVYDVTLGYCQDPGNVTNGTRVIDHAADEFYFGTVIRFWCDIGYELLGPTAIQCVNGQDDVSWNGSLPSCSKLRQTVTTTAMVIDKPSNGPESTHVSPMVTTVTVPHTHVSQRVPNVTVTALEPQVTPGFTNVTVSETHVTPMIHNVTVTTSRLSNVTVTAPETQVTSEVTNVTTSRLSNPTVTVTESRVSSRVTNVSVPDTQVTTEVTNVSVTAPNTHVSPKVSNPTVTKLGTHVSPRITKVPATEAQVTSEVDYAIVTAPETHVSPIVTSFPTPETQVTPDFVNVTVTAPESLVYPRVASPTVTIPETNVTTRVADVTVTKPETPLSPGVANVTVTEPETYKVNPTVPNVNVDASETKLSPKVTHDTVTVPGTQVPVVTVTTPVPGVKGTHEPVPEDRQNCWMNLGLIIAIVVGIAICILLHTTMLILCFVHLRQRRVKRYSCLTIDKRARASGQENGHCRLEDSGAPSSVPRYSSVRRGDRGPRIDGENNNNETTHDVIMMQCCDSQWVENGTYESVGLAGDSVPNVTNCVETSSE